MNELNSLAVFIPIIGIISSAFVIASVLRYRSQRFAALSKSAEAGESTRHVELLANANDKLSDKVGRLEERIAVLERIATDPAGRTAREIEQLR